MSVAVRFGGSSSDYHSIVDVNLMDADAAHLEQSVPWNSWYQATGFAQSQDLTPVFGTYHGICNPSGDGAATVAAFYPASASTSVAVTPSTEYTFSVWVSADQADIKADLIMYWFTSGDAYISQDEGSYETVTVGDWVQVTVTATAPGTAGYCMPGIQWNPTAGSMSGTDKLYWDAACFCEGSDATFVPSLNVVGTVGETKNPSDIAVGYAADGTPLTIGKSWSGDGVQYVRYDGAVNVGPIVCQWDAEDWINV